MKKIIGFAMVTFIFAVFTTQRALADWVPKPSCPCCCPCPTPEPWDG